MLATTSVVEGRAPSPGIQGIGSLAADAEAW